MMRSPKLILDISQSQMESLSLECSSNFIPRMIKMEHMDDQYDTNNNTNYSSRSNNEMYQLIHANDPSPVVSPIKTYIGAYMQSQQMLQHVEEDLNLPRNDILEAAVPAGNFAQDFAATNPKKRKYRAKHVDYYQNYSTSSTDSGISENKKFRFDEVIDYEKSLATPTTIYKYNDKPYEEPCNNGFYQQPLTPQTPIQHCDIKQQYPSPCESQYINLDENSFSPQFAPVYYDNTVNTYNPSSGHSQHPVPYYYEPSVTQPQPPQEISTEKVAERKLMKMKEKLTILKASKRPRKKQVSRIIKPLLLPEDIKETRVMANVRERQRTQR